MSPRALAQGWGGPTADLAAKADIIAIGTVVGEDTLLHDEGGVDTVFTILLEEYLKGKVQSDLVKLVIMGGRHPSGQWISLGSIANEFDYFHSGDEVLLYGCFITLDETTIYQCRVGPSLYRRVRDGNGFDTVVDLEGFVVSAFGPNTYLRTPISAADLLYSEPGTIGARVKDAMSWTEFTEEVRASVLSSNAGPGKVWIGAKAR